MPRIVETWAEFKARQGCEYIVTGRQISYRTGDDVNRIVFANGAVSDGTLHFDPPTNSRQLLEVRREYVQAKLKAEIVAFRNFKNEVLDQAALAKRFLNLPPAPENAPDVLRAGQERITKLREELAALDLQLQDPVVLQRQRQQAEQEANRSLEQSKLVSECQMIEI